MPNTPSHSSPETDPKEQVRELLNRLDCNRNAKSLQDWLQGFSLALYGNRYEPFEIIIQSLEKISDAETRTQIEEQLTMELSEILDKKYDRLLPMYREQTPGPDNVRLPETMLYNGLIMAQHFARPEILGRPLRDLYSREQEESIFQDNLRTALMDALKVNQDDDSLLPLWTRFAESKQTDQEYFLAAPEDGLRGLAVRLRMIGEKLDPAVSLQKRRRQFRKRLESILQNAPSLGTADGHATLADWGQWPKWMAEGAQ